MATAWDIQDALYRKATTQKFSLTSLGGGGGGGIGGIGGSEGVDRLTRKPIISAAESMRERLAASDFGRQQQAFSEKTNASSRLQAEGAAQALAAQRERIAGQSKLQREGADQRSRIQKEGADQREAAKAGDRSAAMKAIAEMIARRRAGMS